MSHVDDGNLHAYLDGALESREERFKVEDHLRVCPDCRTRLEAARGDREGAGEILGLLAPEEVRVPPFEELLAWRGSHGGEAGAGGEDPVGPPPGPTSRPRGMARGMPRGMPRTARLAWAATVVLALGGGWVARGALMPGMGVEGGRADLSRGPDLAAEVSAPEVGTPPPVAQAPLPAERAREAPAEAPGETVAEAAREAPAEVAEEALAEVAPRALAEAAPEAPATADGAPEAPAAVAGAMLAADRTQVADRLGRMEPEVEEGTWTPVSPAEAAALLGHPPLEVDALPWSTMDISTVEGALVLRTTHPLEDGTEVELLQGPGARARTAAAAPPTVLATRRGGVDLLLRGPVDPEVLEGLLRRIR